MTEVGIKILRIGKSRKGGKDMTHKNSIYIAYDIAKQAHSNQVDKGGHPYIEHVIRVSLKGVNKNEVIVGLLHDVIEDTDVSVDILGKYFTKDIVDAIVLLSRGKEQKYNDYIMNIRNNPLARSVKINDMTDNMDLSRISKVTDEDLSRNKRYEKSMRLLKNID